jgi:hypothetical protein
VLIATTTSWGRFDAAVLPAENERGLEVVGGGDQVRRCAAAVTAEKVGKQDF